MSASVKPPASVAAQAKKGLALRKKFGRGGTSIGVARAVQLSNRENVSLDTIKRMRSYFARHEIDKKGKDWNNKKKPSNGKIAWLLWGGDPGRAWANSVYDRLSEGVVDKTWDGSKSRFELDELMRAVPASVLKYAKRKAKRNKREISKDDLKLPYREPNGDVNLSGVRAALESICGERGSRPSLPGSVLTSAKEELKKVLETGTEELSARTEATRQEIKRTVESVRGKSPTVQRKILHRLQESAQLSWIDAHGSQNVTKLNQYTFFRYFDEDRIIFNDTRVYSGKQVF